MSMPCETRSSVILLGDSATEYRPSSERPRNSKPSAALEPSETGKAARSGSSLYVIFLQDPATDDLRSTFANLSSAMDQFRCSRREIYWCIQSKLSESKLFGAELEKATRGVPTTTRNMTTLRRLVAKLDVEQTAPGLFQR